MFALESAFIAAYARHSFRALGFFVIHVAGKSYGVREPNASMLACSFEEVGRRIAARGTHTAHFAGADAVALAKSVREALYDDNEVAITSCGVPPEELSEVVHSRNLLWAPDGDEAFDDGSYVLQFDTQQGVRIIAFETLDTGGVDLGSVADVYLRVDEFYELLARWHSAFEDEWRKAPKSPEDLPQ